MVLVPGGAIVNALIVLGMLVLIVFMARNFRRVAKEPERRLWRASRRPRWSPLSGCRAG